ncbi:MAG: SgcJ/EcaC family oxidoreductase [Hyphomonadaceae bacterium]
MSAAPAKPALSPADVVAAQFEAYNAQDIEAFCACYAPDAVLASHNGDVLAEGLEAIRARHVTLFATHPQNRARLVHRIALPGTVIDHEDVERAPGGERFQVAAIYSFRDGLIGRVEFAR